jgi:GNAT superfamily N-acetyltransferase
MSGPVIAVLDADALDTATRELAELLAEVVEAGASIGFLRPLSVSDARAFWRSLAGDVRDERIVILAATVGGRIAGTVQLRVAPLPNARHRAEVAKLMVRPSLRRHGIGRVLMTAAESEARRRARTLLVLDTETESGAERFYEELGWTRVGEVPGYARNAGGDMRATTIFYKEVT